MEKLHTENIIAHATSGRRILNAELSSPKYRQRVIISKKVYSRRKHSNDSFD